jgi:hypothetical protein
VTAERLTILAIPPESRVPFARPWRRTGSRKSTALSMINLSGSAARPQGTDWATDGAAAGTCICIPHWGQWTRAPGPSAGRLSTA